jgi:site-specific DNA-methyltransferase (cytosine-N4-specific)
MTEEPGRRWKRGDIGALRNGSAIMPALRNVTELEQRACEGCGDPIVCGRAGRPRRFCSNACRQQAYRARNGLAARPTATDSYRSGPGWALYLGHAAHVLDQLPGGSVQTIVTSPPYFGLRDYKAHPDQIGLEPTVQAYVDALAEVCHAAARVLRPDGTLWLNLGDSYSSRANTGPSVDRHAGRGHRQGVTAARVNTTATAPIKSLLLIPSRVALALQADDWIVRNDIIWHKPNAMPESVTDRLANRYDHLLLLSRRPRYYFDLNPIREPHQQESRRNLGLSETGRAACDADPNVAGKNPGDVWRIANRPSPSEHFAMYPVDLPRRCIAAASRPGDVVLDPFAGLSTTGRAALSLGRRYIGGDINAEYHDTAAAALDELSLQVSMA